MRAATALVALLVLLAGCTGNGGSTKGPRLADGSALDVAPTQEGKGSLAGVVVDEAIRPIVGASVMLTNSGANSTTDDQGVFGWPDLEPGTYFVQVRAIGFLNMQSYAEVMAGETAFLRIQLATDLSPQPYHTTYKHDGFMQVWGGIAQYYVENAAPTGTCNCRMYFTPAANVTNFIYEAFWKPTTPDPGGLGKYYWILDEAASRFNPEEYCFSPCYARVGSDGYTGTQVMARLDGPDYWTAYQQSVTIYVTTWHVGPAPDGWSITNQ